MQKLDKAARKAQQGQYIFAYCHVGTNQVLYSLSRVMHNRLVQKQLPDLGANNRPRALRKDLWKPLFTVNLPDSLDGRAQGLHAYRKLLEWRKLHETSWTPSPLLSRPFTADEIKEMEEELQQRGGSKRESVWDLIKREKKKMRVRDIKDQKANSIADLAAVLMAQEVQGSKVAKAQTQERTEDRRKEVRYMQSLNKLAQEGELDRIDEEIIQIEEKMAESRAGNPQASEGQSLNSLRSRLSHLRIKSQMMRFSVNAMSELLAGRGDSSSRRSLQDYSEEELMSILPSFPSRTETNIPKRGPVRQKLNRLAAPIFTTKGVTVSWQNILDAEYAPAWPQDVKHLVMGYSRHVAPDPRQRPGKDPEALDQITDKSKGDDADSSRRRGEGGQEQTMFGRTETAAAAAA